MRELSIERFDVVSSWKVLEAFLIIHSHADYAYDYKRC